MFGTLSETSTGTGHPVEAIGRIVAETPALLAVDGISGVGAMECRTDDGGSTSCASARRRPLMLPPGLAFVSVSPKAWAKIDTFDSHSYYFNLKAARKKIKEFDTPYTPAHTLISGSAHGLAADQGRGDRKRLAAPSPNERSVPGRNSGARARALQLPAGRGLDRVLRPGGPEGECQIRNKLAERFGITTVGGQDKLKGKIVRIGHMGYTDELDVIGTLAALEMTLAELGLRRRAGPGRHRRPAGLDRSKACGDLRYPGI